MLTIYEHMNIITYEQIMKYKNKSKGEDEKTMEKQGQTVETDNKETDSKEYLAAHRELVEKVQKSQPSEEHLYDLAELFKMFGDSTRVKILFALIESELCVGDLAQILNLTQSSVSHQLRLLKDAKLVRFRRDGKIIFYSLADEHVRTILHMGMEHVEEP